MNFHTGRRSLVAGAAPKVLAAAVAIAMATPARAADDTSLIEEVVVTAQKRTERLQDVPLAVTAVSGEALETRQINDTNNLVAVAPSLTYQQGGNVTNSSFRLRGIGSSLFGQGVESSVSVVLDGVVTARGSQSFTDLSDIDRVEVLRGPQGTLFGKNATAGVISVVTQRPSWTFGGRATGTVEEGGDYRTSGTITGPLSDAVAARLSAYYKHERGQTRNLGAGGHVNGRPGWGVRGKLEFKPTDKIDLLATIDYREENSECCQTVAIISTTPVLSTLQLPAVASRTSDEVANDGLTFNDSTQATYSFQGDWDLGFATVTSLTAYQDFHLDNNAEVDGLFNPVPEFGGQATTAAKSDINGGPSDIEQFSQELRLASSGDGRFTYVAGVYFSELKIDRGFSRRRAVCAAGTAAQLGTPCTPLRFESIASLSTLRSKHLAAFAQAELEVVDRLKLIGGLRVQRERVSVVGQRTGVTVPGDAFFGATPSVRAGKSVADNAVTGKAGVQYEFSRDAQAYATYTRGYKGLGLNTELAADFGGQAPIRPENVDAYEAGFKGQTPDRRFSVAAAVFRADYTDLQVQVNRNNPDLGIIQNLQTNAGSSRTQGVEIEAAAKLSDRLSLNAALTYTDASIDLDGGNCSLAVQVAAPTVLLGQTPPDNACFRIQTRNPTTGVITVSTPIQNIRGGHLQATPKWTVMFGPMYRFDIGEAWTGVAQINATYRSAQFFSLDQDPGTRQKAYALVDASLALAPKDSPFRLTLFVKNLFDENYYTNISRGSTAQFPNDFNAFRPKNADRYVGATLDARF